MPIRATFALIVTVVSLFLLFNFKTPDLATTGTPVKVPAPTPQPTPTSTASSSATAVVTPSPTPAGPRDGTYTGQPETMFYGTVQVSVTFSAGKITQVQNLQLPSDRQQSAYISQYAGPMLQSQVLQAQSANINGVSGATYTSEAYAQSVQSALTQAGA